VIDVISSSLCLSMDIPDSCLTGQACFEISSQAFIFIVAASCKLHTHTRACIITSRLANGNDSYEQTFVIDGAMGPAEMGITAGRVEFSSHLGRWLDDSSFFFPCCARALEPDEQKQQKQ